MEHICYGEYCIINGSWDCPNRADREKADKRPIEDIEKARKYVKLAMKSLFSTK